MAVYFCFGYVDLRTAPNEQYLDFAVVVYVVNRCCKSKKNRLENIERFYNKPTVDTRILPNIPTSLPNNILPSHKHSISRP